MKWWPLNGRPTSHVAPGDRCRIRNRDDVKPRYRGALCVVSTDLKRQRFKGSPACDWVHGVDCDVTPNGGILWAPPDHLIKLPPDWDKLGSWASCPFKPKALARQNAPLP